MDFNQPNSCSAGEPPKIAMSVEVYPRADQANWNNSDGVGIL